jgi:hypothetical protein
VDIETRFSNYLLPCEGKKYRFLRSQNRTRDLSITMKLLQSNVINQLHQAEEYN